MIDDDLPEFIGADKSTLATPKRKAAPVVRYVADAEPVKYNPHPEIDGLEDDEPAAHVEPAPRVTPYTPPAPGSSHPRHAILGPVLRLDEAEAALNRASVELTLATRHLRECERAEANAEAALMKELPGPTPDDLLRQHVAAELKQRADNVAAGRKPDARNVPVHGKSELDRVGASRARPAPGMASSLRSNVVRRSV